ncbi:hypothetical protein [Planomonospora algeriensis]
MTHPVFDRRTWSDAQLVDAVSGSSSWRGVLRELGLNASSAGSIRVVRRHVERLGLDTGHFTGQRRWSDTSLASAVNDGRSWPELLDLLGLQSDSGSNRAAVRVHPARLGLDMSRFDGDASGVRLSRHAMPKADLSQLRSAAPAMAMAWFALRGCAVALPVEPQVYDLLVTVDDVIRCVQVKSTTSMSDDGWMVNVQGRHVYGRSTLIPYDPKDLDFFLHRGWRSGCIFHSHGGDSRQVEDSVETLSGICVRERIGIDPVGFLYLRT